MDILDISMDDNEADTSQDELEEEDDDGENTSSSNSKKMKNDIYQTESLIHDTFKAWERPSIPEGTLFYTSTVLEEQPEAFQFFILDSVSTLTAVKHPKIVLDPDVRDLPLHNVMR
jgi:hypothetical protein